jgi:hypothetical protein
VVDLPAGSDVFGERNNPYQIFEIFRSPLVRRMYQTVSEPHTAACIQAATFRISLIRRTYQAAPDFASG